MHRLGLFTFICAVLAVFATAQNITHDNQTPSFPESKVTSHSHSNQPQINATNNQVVTSHINSGNVAHVSNVIVIDRNSITNDKNDCQPDTIETENYKYIYNNDITNFEYHFERNNHYVKLTLEGDRTGISIHIKPHSRGLKEDIVFTNDTISQIRWNIESDLTITEHAGEYRFTDSTGRTHFYTHRADAMDASGHPVIVHSKLATNTLLYTLDVNEHTTWPVTMDPSTGAISTLDGYIQQSSQSTYSDARNANSGYSYSSALAVGQQVSDNYSVFRSFLAFPIPDLSTATACTLFVKGKSDYSVNNFELYIMGASEYSSMLDNDDYSHFDGYETEAAYTGAILNEVWSTISYSNNWNAIIFNNTGLDSIEIARNDTVWIAMVSKEDYENSPPSNDEFVFFESSSDETYKPYLSLTYSKPSSFMTIQTHSDGRIRSTNINTYAGARDAQSAYADINWTQVGQLANTIPTYSVFRGYFSFAMPNINSVNACTLFVNGSANFSTDADFDLYFVGADEYGSFLDNNDFPCFDGRQTTIPHTGTILNETWNSGNYLHGWNAIVFNTAGLDSIIAASNDTLRIAMISRNDYENKLPTGNEYVIFESSISTGEEPYIALEYIPGIIPPSNFTMIALDESRIACQWDDTDYESCYHIIDMADSTILASLNSNSTADTLNGLSPNSLHSWAVIADSLGTEGISAPDSCYTLLSAPTRNEIRIQPIRSDTLYLSVPIPPNYNDGYSGFEVAAISGYGSDNSGQLSGTYAYYDGGLHPDSTYTFSVRYFNGDGIPSTWSDTVSYKMNGLETLSILLANDTNDDYTINNNGAHDSLVVRTGIDTDGAEHNGYFTFSLPWYVHKGGIDSVSISLYRETESSTIQPTLSITSIPETSLEPAEFLNLGAQETTVSSIPWTILSGAGQRTSPDLRQVFREWQLISPLRDYPYTFSIRLDGSEQADSLYAVFRDASHPQWDNNTYLKFYYTPGNPDSLDAPPQNFQLTPISPDSIVASWADVSQFELGFLLLQTADSTIVANTDTLVENTQSIGIGGLIPDTMYQMYVQAFSVVDNMSSLSASTRTPSRIPGLTTISALSDSTISFAINPFDNPLTTMYAVEDSLTGFYIDGSVEPSVFRVDPPGEWAWQSYEAWGAAAGDTLSNLFPDSLYVLRVKARSQE